MTKAHLGDVLPRLQIFQDLEEQKKLPVRWPKKTDKFLPLLTWTDCPGPMEKLRNSKQNPRRKVAKLAHTGQSLADKSEVAIDELFLIHTER
jgi:hypothetical protein